VYPQIFVGGRDTTTAGLVAFWAVFYLWAGSEVFLGWLLRARARNAKQSDAGSIWILIGSIWGAVAVGILLSVLVPGTAFTRDRRFLLVFGLALMLAGMGLRWYSIRVLGQSFTSTVATRPDQRVVETGPYRWIRHPSYSGSLLTVLGCLICLMNPLAFLGWLIAIAGYGYRIKVEEEALARDLGDPYRRYMKRTKRLIPFLV
jgi:protein-S-isoprenylcysteine O-methyltransferase Ste14